MNALEPTPADVRTTDAGADRDIAIEARGLTKRYRVYRTPADRLKEMACFGRRRLHREFTALDGLDLTVPKGQTTGVIGPNGAGKSTLLKILAGIVAPTSGELIARGSVASIIELGAGFHPEFSGIENIYLNAGILGFSREQTDAMVERICRFAELGEYIHVPVKTYSSGMFARLAFAIAINLDPDILLIDEALAVGDAVFANRCLSKIRRMRERGVTIFFVSHDINAVGSLCDHVLLLDRGRLVCAGKPKQVIGRYQEAVAERLAQPEESSETVSVHSVGAPASTGDDIVEQRFGTFEARVAAIEILNSQGAATARLFAGEAARVRMRVVFEEDIADPVFGVMIKNRYGIEIFGTNTRLKRLETGRFLAGQTVDVTFSFRARIGLGVYALSVAVHTADNRFFDYRVDAATFEVVGALDSIGYCPLETDIEWKDADAGEATRDDDLRERLYGDAPAALTLDEAAAPLLAGTWHSPHEDEGRVCRWAGQSASVHLRPAADARRLAIDWRDIHGGEPAGPGRVSVSIDGVEVASLRADTPEWRTSRVKLGKSPAPGAPRRVTLRAERAWVPRDTQAGSTDDRSFSVMVARVGFE